MATVFTANSDAAIEDAAGTDPEPYPPSCREPPDELGARPPGSSTDSVQIYRPWFFLSPITC